MRCLLILLLSISISSAEFLIEKAEVTVSDIQPDGSAKVHESIKILMRGEYSISVYDSGISNNKLSVWSANTELKDVKFHINQQVVDLQDVRIRPQPRTGCNPVSDTCHGELILDYIASPSFEAGSDEPVPGTGLFFVDKYKPRTNRYTLNPDALSFETNAEGNTIIEDRIFFTIDMPDGNVLLDVNPFPSDTDFDLPSRGTSSLSWTDIVLVKFALVFDVEEGIDKEVTDFFGNILKGAKDALTGPQGLPLMALLVVLTGSYLYITMAKRRGED